MCPTIPQQYQGRMSRTYVRDKDERSTDPMVEINWAPVGVVLALVTGVASLATLDLQVVSVVVGAFTAGVMVGRYSFRQPDRHQTDGGQRE